MSSTINVTPVQLSSPVTKVQIVNVTINLYTNAIFRVALQDANQNTISLQNLYMSPTDYSNWNSDDSYATAWILTQLGLTAA